MRRASGGDRNKRTFLARQVALTVAFSSRRNPACRLFRSSCRTSRWVDIAVLRDPRSCLWTTVSTVHVVRPRSSLEVLENGIILNLQVGFFWSKRNNFQRSKPRTSDFSKVFLFFYPAQFSLAGWIHCRRILMRLMVFRTARSADQTTLYGGFFGKMKNFDTCSVWCFFFFFSCTVILTSDSER